MTLRSFGITGRVPEEIVRDLAPRLEVLGYHRLWINDIPGGDSLAKAAIAVECTSWLRLATGVIPIDRRPPSQIAADISRLGIPIDRLLVGIGSGQVKPPLRRVREAIAELRQLLGPDAKLSVGALGPKMTALGAELADNVLLNWVTPEAARISRDIIADHAREAQRPTPEVSAYIRVALGAAALPNLEEEAARYSQMPSYAKHFERFTMPAMTTTVHGEDVATIQAGLAAYEGTVDEVVVRAIVAEETIAAYLELAEAAAPRKTATARPVGESSPSGNAGS